MEHYRKPGAKQEMEQPVMANSMASSIFSCRLDHHSFAYELSNRFYLGLSCMSDRGELTVDVYPRWCAEMTCCGYGRQIGSER